MSNTGFLLRETMTINSMPAIFIAVRVLSAVAAALLLHGCSKPEAPATPSTEKPVAVTTAVAAMRDTPDIYQATGTVRARTRSVLAAQVMGTIRHAPNVVGDRVAAGQTLVTLEAPQFASGQAQAQAAVAEAEGALPEATAGITAARSQLALAEATHQRMSDLFGKASISRQEMDESAARLQQARTAVDMAQARQRQVEARGQQARQALESARTMSGYLTIRAPFAGVITEKFAQSGMVASPGVPLLTLEQAGAYELEASIDEGRAAAMKPGLELQAHFAELSQPVPLRIGAIVPVVDPATRTLLVRAPLPGGPNWHSGQFARAEFRLGWQSRLTIPAAALVVQGQLQFVYVIEAGHAISRMVTTAPAGSGAWEVLSGLKEGHVVISPVPAALRHGLPVVTQ